MKRFLSSIIWFSSGAGLGQFTDSILFPLWAKLGLLMPVAHWLAAFGNDFLLRCWLAVYVSFLSWLFVILVGVLGGVFIKRQLVINLLLFGLGFAFIPLLIYAYLNSTVPGLSDILRQAVLIVLVIVSGLVSYRWSGHLKSGSNYFVAS